MAFPYIFQSNFDRGTSGDWDSEQDTGSKMDFPHYTELARIPGAPMPWRGAYLCRIDLTSGDTNDHTVTEGDIDIADAGTAYFRWMMFVSSSFTATADDTFNIFELQQAGGTVEQAVSFRMTAATNLMEIGFGDGTAAASFVPFTGRGRWVCIELLSTISTGGSGVSTLFLDGTQIQTQTSSTQAAAVGQGVLGVQNCLATTTGQIYLDQFVMDDTRIGVMPQRWPETVYLTQSGHVFVGQGTIENISLLSGAGTDCVLTVYDTDVANTNNQVNIKAVMKNTANNELVDPAGMPIHVQRGCYISMSGTTPVAIVKVGFAQGWGSEGRIRQHAENRKPAPGNW